MSQVDYLPVFPVAGSLKEAADYAESQLPITRKNDLLALLSMYQNTLLRVTARQCPYTNNTSSQGVPPCK